MCFAVPSEKNNTVLVMSRDESDSSAPPYTDADPPYTTSNPPTQSTKKGPPEATTSSSSSSSTSNSTALEPAPSTTNNNVPATAAAMVEIVVQQQDEQQPGSKEENALSAFAITSVLPADHDDLESSMAQQTRLPASTDDSITLQTTAALRGDSSEEDSISLSEEQKVVAASNSLPVVTQEHSHTAQEDSRSVDTPTPAATSSPSEPPSATTTVVEPAPTQSASSSTLVPMASVPSVALASTDSLSSVDEPSSRTTSSLAAASMSNIGAGSANGPSVQPGASRFRKINNYVRGRWMIRDTTAPEDHRAGEGSGGGGSTSSCDSRYPGSGRSSNAQDPPTTGSASPIIGHRRPTNELSDALHTRSTSDLGNLIGGGGGVGLGLMVSSPCIATSDSDRDSHVDRSSTAADTLSRNTSLSSIPPMEKSIDGDDHLREVETESVASASGSVRDTPENTGGAPSSQAPAIAATAADAQDTTK